MYLAEPLAPQHSGPLVEYGFPLFLLLCVFLLGLDMKRHQRACQRDEEMARVRLVTDFVAFVLTLSILLLWVLWWVRLV